MRIGVDLGGTKIEAIALGDDGRERGRVRLPTPRDDYAGTLAAIAHVVQGEHFEKRWMEARNESNLIDLILLSKRRRSSWSSMMTTAMIYRMHLRMKQAASGRYPGKSTATMICLICRPSLPLIRPIPPACGPLMNCWSATNKEKKTDSPAKSMWAA